MSSCWRASLAVAVPLRCRRGSERVWPKKKTGLSVDETDTVALKLCLASVFFRSQRETRSRMRRERGMEEGERARGQLNGRVRVQCVCVVPWWSAKKWATSFAV